MENKLTPIEHIDGVFVKRDDLFTVAGVCGGKARTCWYLSQGARGLVTASSRYSPQALIVAHIAQYLGIPSVLHMPSGAETKEMLSIKSCNGRIVQHTPGYNTVIIRRAKDDVLVSGFVYIPFGMECGEAVKQTAGQVKSIPGEVQRIVIPVGSGMSLSGLLHGLKNNGINVPVLGVVVGASPVKRLNRYAPLFWANLVTLVSAGVDYDKRINAEIGGISLDPIYEAKCLGFLHKGDLLWIIGNRNG